MDTDDTASAAGFADNEPRVSKRQLAQHAVTLAVQSRWQEAADINRQIIELAPDDAEAHNRLGKAFTEMGKVIEARAAYQDALHADPANLIAQRNLDRLSQLTEAEAAEMAKRARHKLDPRFFIEETGKTGLTNLHNTADSATIATLLAGDEVMLKQQDNELVVTTVDGVYAGRVDDRLTTRLLRLMQSGNQYQAGIVGVDGNAVRIIIREIVQSPKNAGRISFPPKGKQEGLPRPYLREGLLRRGGDDEDEDELDIDPDVDVDEDEDDEAGEFGFHEASLDES